ncbi:MAG: molybdate ABC transporter substrate-binding protein [Deltaproteobacteria bacterium]|nr:molybdate ABC transporter substrate-binding protein [Deltaproteobacteria bacterium]
MAWTLLLAACGREEPDAPGGPVVRVWAAASMTEVVEEVCDRFEASGQGRCEVAFGSSAVLARQIEEGGPADVLFSADPAWSERLEARGLLEVASGGPRIGNALVVVVPAEAALIPSAPEDLRDGRLVRVALGDPHHVPAGRYARQALEALGLWAAVEPRVLGAPDVRAALALVESGAAPCGVVYRTDALTSGRVRVAFPLPQAPDTRMRYVVGRVLGDERSPAASAFLELFLGEAGREALIRRGFEVTWD